MECQNDVILDAKILEKSRLIIIKKKKKIYESYIIIKASKKIIRRSLKIMGCSSSKICLLY
jgi:hypothetical protein